MSSKTVIVVDPLVLKAVKVTSPVKVIPGSAPPKVKLPFVPVVFPVPDPPLSPSFAVKVEYQYLLEAVPACASGADKPHPVDKLVNAEFVKL